jgi:AmmeMemoRadiSam system protein A
VTSALASLPTIAVDAIAHTLCTGRRRVHAPADLPPELARPGAAFVTLERGDALLGCIGTLTPDKPLGSSVAHSAIAAAFDDPRMPAVGPDDFPVMRVKVSVLSDPEPLAVGSRAALVTALEPGTTGVVVERDRRRATFLPAVWAKLPDPDDFLDALWTKAGLRARVWDARVRVATYTTVELVDPGPRPRLEAIPRDA